MRFKNIGKLFGIGAIALVMAGCGGGGGGTSVGSTPPTPPVEPAPPAYTPGGPNDAMMEEHMIIIMYNYPVEVCRDPATKEKMEKSLNFNPETPIVVILQVESNDIDCGTYGRVYADGTCLQGDMSLDPPFEEYDTSCVMGWSYSKNEGLDIEETVSILEDVALEALE